MDHNALPLIQAYKLKFTSVPVLLGALFSVYIVYTYVASYRRLRHIPGPRIAGWSNIWYVWNAVSGKHWQYQRDVCDKFGPLVRIGPNTVVTSDEDLIREMNAVRGPFGKTNWYKAFRFDAEHDNLVSIIDEKAHDTMRARLAPGYAGKDNPNLESDIDSAIWSLIRLIQRKYISKRSTLVKFDFALAAQFLTLDVITTVGLGSSFGWLDDDEDKFQYVKTWTANIPIVSFLASVPPLAYLMSHPKIQPYLVPSVKERAGLGAIKAAAREKISHRFGPSKEVRNDMTQSFINHGLTEHQIADETLLQIVAGSDTTATVLRTAIQQIITNPVAYRTLQQECDASEIPLSRLITDSEATKFPYLTACIRESLRIRTPVAGMLPRKVPKQGYTYTNPTTKQTTFLPGDTEIGMSMTNVQHNPVIFSPDPTSFRPSRWLNSPPNLDQMLKTVELNFSHGRFRCLGERISKMEMHKVVFELFRRYELCFVDSSRPVEWEANYGLWYMRGMWLRVEERVR